jgi:hypothetical protein
MPSYIRFLVFSLMGMSVLSCTQDAITPAEIFEGHFAYVYPEGGMPLQNISTMANCQGPNGT